MPPGQAVTAIGVWPGIGAMCVLMLAAAEVHPGLAVAGGSFAASFGREPYGAAAAARGTPW